jgi:formate hydrogenlyase subunit 4
MIGAPAISAWLALGVLILAAPIVPGVAVRTKALFAGRRGAPVWQLYADLWKLARRGIVYSTTITWVFRLAPVALVATTITAAALLPLDGHRGLIAFSGDAVAFVCLFALGRFVLVLAALDTGSSFEGMGASRDVTFATLIEPGLFVALAALAIAADSHSLTGMLGARSAVGAADTPALVLIAASIFALMLAECARVPVDDPATHLELTMVHEVMILDHSGPDLALVLYAQALKLATFAALILGVLLPPRSSGGWVSPLALLGSLVVIGIAVGVVESVMARLRLPRVPLFVAAGGSVALFGLILLLR